MTTGRDPVTGRLQPGHAVRPVQRGGPSAADRIAAYIRPHEKEVVDRLIDLAKQGDPKSMALFMQYTAAPAKPPDETVSIPGFAEASTLQAKAEAVIAAAATGACSTAAAERLLRVLDVYSRAIKADEFDARLKAIEAGRVVPQAPPPADVIDIDIDQFV